MLKCEKERSSQKRLRCEEEKRMGKTKGSGTKQAVVVVGALACVWFAIEIALKPFLRHTRSAIDKSDPNRDPDDVPDASPPEVSPPAGDGATETKTEA
ncbi:outer envelope membrane protein 7-like [Senna tora]|uniref:Outer envelope membrane protein 7-like n=1 Tax=Senna tora TaxID=362788 RepID=A0A834TBL7_9FABA|nr:outer envelope membrane protein 7-like [Senna tora]